MNFVIDVICDDFPYVPGRLHLSNRAAVTMRLQGFSYPVNNRFENYISIAPASSELDVAITVSSP